MSTAKTFLNLSRIYSLAIVIVFVVQITLVIRLENCMPLTRSQMVKLKRISTNNNWQRKALPHIPPHNAAKQSKPTTNSFKTNCKAK